MRPFRTRTVLPLLAALAAAGCAAAPPSAAQGVPAPAVQARPDSSRYAWTEADVRFMTSMIGHHAQAIEMAELAPARAHSPLVKTLAARIINAQRDEIATMERWLRDHGQPVPEVHPTAHHGDLHAGMPGMVSPAQMGELAAARGQDFDHLFLTRMIDHHRGAVVMVDALFNTPGAGLDETVFRLATDVNVDQITEIARMQRLMADLLFESPSR